MHSPYNTAKRLRPLAAALMLSVTLTACGGGSSSPDAPIVPPVTTPTNAERVASLEASGALPRLDRSADLKGPDANANGVRDDIDAWIVAQNLPAARAKALTRVAKTAQLALGADVTDQSAVRAIARQGMRDANCISTVFSGDIPTNGGYSISRKVETYTFNTKSRFLAYAAFNKALSGAVLTLPSGDTCDE